MLQLVPELRGEWLFDPMTGTRRYIEYGLVWQWMVGGFVATVLLGMLSPFLGQLVFFAQAGSAVGRVSERAAVDRFQQQVGLVELPVELVVRKRKKGSAAAAAVPLEVLPASLHRRFFARVVDASLLFSTLAGTALFVQLLLTGGLALPARLEPLTWLAMVAMGALLVVVQGWGQLGSGQTIGKLGFDIRVVRPDAPTFDVRAWLVRELSFTVGSLLFATLVAASVGWGVLEGVSAWGYAEQFDLPRLRLAVVLLAWPGGFLVGEALRGLPALVGRAALHDLPLGTHVVRTRLSERAPEQGTPLMVRRVLARLTDLAFGLGAGGLLVLSGGWIRWQFGPEQTDLALLFAGAGLVLAAGIRLAFVVDVAHSGASPGRRLWGVVIHREGEPPGLGGAFVRELLVPRVLGLLPFVGGFLDLMFGVFHPEGRTLHDVIANTRVVDTRNRGEAG